MKKGARTLAGPGASDGDGDGDGSYSPAVASSFLPG